MVACIHVTYSILFDVAFKGPCNCVKVDSVKVVAVSWAAVLVGD